MDAPVAEARTGNLVLKIFQDMDPESPREWSHLGTMICWHRQYRLGDENPYGNAREFAEGLLADHSGMDEGQVEDELARVYDEQVDLAMKRVPPDLKRINSPIIYTYTAVAIIEDERWWWALPLYLLDHSGITISTSSSRFRAVDSAGWDWGQIGWIYVAKSKAREEFGQEISDKDLEEKVLAILRAEVATYDSFLRGDVYGFVLEREETCESCGHTEAKVIESVWGFYPEPDPSDGLLRGGKSAEDSLSEQIKEHLPIEAKPLTDLLEWR